MLTLCSFWQDPETKLLLQKAANRGLKYAVFWKSLDNGLSEITPL